MLPGTIMHLPAVALLAFANVTLPSLDSAEETGAPRRPSALQPAGRWSTASWEPCSNPCGAGEEQRSVSCVLEDAESTLIVVTDSFCAPPRPTSVRPCYQYRSECANTWVTGDWGQCSAKCGGGQRSRVVECHAGAGAGRAGAGDGVPDAPPAPLPPAQCVPQLRPAERRDCNLQPCPDGRRVWLRISDDSRPRRIRLFSKFTLRCPFHVYWTPADDRSKRKYAWFKDGRRLPLHEDKYTQTDGRGELRVKGADEPDSGEYTCASTTANPQGRTHNFTVKLERVPGDPKPTTPSPQTEEDVDDNDISAETSPEHEDEDAAQETRDDNPTDPAVPAAPAAATEATTTTAGNDSLVEEAPVVEVTDNALPSLPASVPAESVKDTGVIASTGQRQVGVPSVLEKPA
ncbi:ADAMTS-like protein 1 [Frankliniella fusca]|uniref:ADAMTS-like protein 1 n=1 Tax=Frankliniella fusca TaxID=407009 RepID=A0AAE1HHE1_9NEOP|nr:ADAMTS-like protein 1 [Frankliniella fusca]